MGGAEEMEVDSIQFEGFRLFYFVEIIGIKMTKQMFLPYDPEVDAWADRIIEIDNHQLSYKGATRHEKYVDIALGLKQDAKITVPIEFTQFVLRRLAANEKGSRFSADLLHPKAKEFFFSNLIGNRTAEIRIAHPPNYDDEHPSTYRGIFTNVFCKKVIMNLKKVEDRYYDKFARVFPFVVCKNVPDYKIHVLNCYDDNFYEMMQQFLNEHFDNAQARQIIKLFLNNIRKFLKEKPSDYFDTFPRLNEEGIKHQQAIHAEYRYVRKHFNNFSMPYLCYEQNYFETLPEKNIEDLSYLLQSINYRTEYKTYIDIFKKYLFFFVHALEENENQIFFIDDVVYQCLKSLKRYKTVEEDINLTGDIANIALLHLLKFKSQIHSKNRYCIRVSALENVKKYITQLVNGKNVQLYGTFERFDVTVEPAFIIDDIILKIQYAQGDRNCQKGIRDLIDCIVAALLSPEDKPIKHLITYNAFRGQEKRFSIPEELRASLENFIRLSIKDDQPVDSSYNALMTLFEKFLI